MLKRNDTEQYLKDQVVHHAQILKMYQDNNHLPDGYPRYQLSIWTEALDEYQRAKQNENLNHA